MGAHGAGHYVKMVHNGIEYGMMQAIAEGFSLMHKSPYGLDLARIADLWMQGSVVRSWLVELAGRALSEDPALQKIRGWVEDSGEGRCRMRSTSRCRPGRSPPRSSRASAPARRIRSPTACSPRFATSSAGTPSGPGSDDLRDERAALAR